MKCVADMTLLALAELGVAPMPLYEALLREALERYPAPFGQRWYGDSYRQRARDPAWFLHSLIANADKESDGARQLWAIAAHTAAPHIAAQICSHAVDEARHARFYLQMARLTFPHAADDVTWRELMARTPLYTVRDAPDRTTPVDAAITLDELIQTNIGEIRTRIHQLLLRSVIVGHCAPEVRDRLVKLVDAVLHDETRHIAYTAALIDNAMREGQDQLVRDILVERLQQFNALTLVEVEADAGIDEHSPFAVEQSA